MEEKYLDSPDGENLPNKLWIALKRTGVFAVALSTVDILLYSHPKGYVPTLYRYLYISVPVLAMSSSFVVVSNLAANQRGKDDELNWIGGACAAGVIFGLWRKSLAACVAACTAFSIAAFVKKNALLNNIVLIPVNVPKRYGTVGMIRHDWTLSRSPPPNWTTGKNNEEDDCC